MKQIAALFVLLTALPVLAQYPTLSQSCDGFLQIAVGSYPGTCLGVLSQSEKFVKPRKAVQLDDQHLLVTDMGGWSSFHGFVWLVQSSQPHLRGDISVTPLLTELNLPHDIELDAKGRVLVGEAHQIRRITLKDGAVQINEVVVKDLPFEKHLHPLTNFVQLADGDLVVNVGSKSDQCDKHIQQGKCSELLQNGLWQYPYDPEQDRYASEGEHLASGLRNSMALAVHESGTLLQAENSSDLKDAEEPYEELNVIQAGGFYGWPYCLNEQFDQSKIPDGCQQANYQPPYLLMPPHVAPLDMMYTQSEKLPMLNGKLLISWHGYRVVGHRLVAYDIDENGLPTLTEKAWYNADPIAPSTEWTRHPYAATGGVTHQAQPLELTDRWNPVNGLRPEGAPVGLLMLMDDTLLIVDDKNKALLRLAPGQSYRQPAELTQTHNTQDRAINQALTKHPALKTTLLEHCSGCHTELRISPALLLNKQSGWLSMEDGKRKVEQALFSDTRPMPPTQSLNDDQKRVLLQQLRQLEAALDSGTSD